MSKFYGIKFNIIVSMDSKSGIGKNGSIPWQIQEHLQQFGQLTEGGTVIMGRKTWESLPVKPLPNRCNIVISMRKDKDIQDFKRKCHYEVLTDKLTHTVDQSNSCDFAIEKAAANDNTIWVIGGESIYEEFIDEASNIYVTHVDGDFKCDKQFPKIPSYFKSIESSGWKQEGNYTYWFEVLRNTNG